MSFQGWLVYFFYLFLVCLGINAHTFYSDSVGPVRVCTILQFLLDADYY